jgi:hypothetical protein
MKARRKDHEPPPAIAKRGWRYHHLGIPTTIPRKNEVHLKRLGLHVSGFDTSPYGVEWMRFDPDCNVSELIRTVPHIAFQVDNLAKALKGLRPIGDISSPSRGVRVAMVVDNGAPIELIEFALQNRTMGTIEEILHSKAKPKAKQMKLVEAVCNGSIPAAAFVEYFVSASDVDKGACADAMKHIAERKPDLLAPHIATLSGYINHPAPRVKWGVPEATGNLAGWYPNEAATAVPALMKNARESTTNTTVIRWCAAFALTEIAKHNTKVQKTLIPKLRTLAKKETNNGVRNAYLRALKSLGK